MKAEILIYGGDGRVFPSGATNIKHWQLWVDGVFLGDTFNPEIGNIYEKIVDKINGSEDAGEDDVTA